MEHRAIGAHGSDGFSSRPLKLPRLHDIPDVSTCAKLFVRDGEPCERMERRLVEVFSVRVCDPEPDKCWVTKEDLYGVVVLKPSCRHFHACLFRRKFQDPPPLDQMGFVKLSGPTHAVEVKDELAIHAYLWLVSVETFFNKEYARVLWRAGVDESKNLCDRVICQKVDTEFNPLEVTFAVYRDGVEAHLEVALIGRDATDEVEVFGTVTTGNSSITDPRACSKLFERSSEEAICVRPGVVATTLPLSRSVTVLPRQSTLLVQIRLWTRGVFTHGKMPDIKHDLVFDPMLGVVEQVVSSDCANVKVKVSWSD